MKNWSLRGERARDFPDVDDPAVGRRRQVDVVGQVGERHKRLTLRQSGHDPFRKAQDAQSRRGQAPFENLTPGVLSRHFFPLAVVRRPIVAPRATALLLHHADIADCHGLVNRLHHVIDGERRHGDRRERFHLDARLRGCAHPRRDLVAAPGRRQFDADVRQGKGVTQRNQDGRLLGRHDPREPGRLQWIPLGHRCPCESPSTPGRSW